MKVLLVIITLVLLGCKDQMVSTNEFCINRNVYILVVTSVHRYMITKYDENGKPEKCNYNENGFKY